MSKRINPDSVWPVSEGSPLVAFFTNATSFARCGTNETSQNGQLKFVVNIHIPNGSRSGFSPNVNFIAKSSDLNY